MIEHIPETKNGYRINESSTNADLQVIYKKYERSGFHCLIMNSKTYQKFAADRYTGKKLITVNNKVPDNTFYVNRLK